MIHTIEIIGDKYFLLDRTVCDWLERQRSHSPCSQGCIVLHMFSSSTEHCSLLLRMCCSSEHVKPTG
jgi:hypothetical protein